MIDVHQHYVPDAYRAELERVGLLHSAGAEVPRWTPTAALDRMDRFGIDGAALSITHPGVSFAGAGAAKLARTCNEELASIRADHPGRFAGIAVLDLDSIDNALAEVEYALDVLHLDGVGLYSNVNGVYPGDPSFDELFAELNRRSAVAFLHPVKPQLPDTDLPPFLLEFVFDTTRAITSLIYGGVVRKYPDLRLIVGHAGGCAPYLGERLDVRVRLPSALADPEIDFAADLGRLYYDLTRSMDQATIAALAETTPADHLLFGTDWPFATYLWPCDSGDAAPKLRTLSPEWQNAILSENALRLFPALRPGR